MERIYGRIVLGLIKTLLGNPGAPALSGLGLGSNLVFLGSGTVDGFLGRGLLKMVVLGGIDGITLGGLGSFPFDVTGGTGGLTTEIAVPAIVVAPNPQTISRTR
jgi:hypothetical protein